MHSTPAIEVDGLERSFGDVRAVDGIAFTAEKGQVLGLLGPNGSGKTTTVRSRVEDRLAVAGITVAEIGLRLPSLDDVFLSLTGRATTGAAA